MKTIVSNEDLKGIRKITYSDGSVEYKYDPLPHQRKVLSMKDKIVYFRAGRGSGKSFLGAELAVRELLHERRVICMAQTSQAIREVMAPEINRQLNLLIPGEFKYSQAFNKFTFGNGTIYLGSYEAQESIRGYTSISLAILDEAALASPDIFSVLSFCMRDCPVEPKIRMLSTPRPANWLSRFVKDRNVPVVTAKTSDNTRITEEEIELMRSTCPDENTWLREFYGQEQEDDTAGIIFSADLLSEIKTVNIGREDIGYCIGYDGSGLGNDNHAIVVRDSYKILDIIMRKTATAAEIASKIRELVFKHGRDRLSHICIDEAYGLDVADRLSEQGLPVHLIAFGGAPENKAYSNQRAEAYFEMKKGLQENGLEGITDDMKLAMMATRYKLSSNNRLQIIPKDEIKANIGHSPDALDALAITYLFPIIPSEAVEARQRYQASFMRD